MATGILPSNKAIQGVVRGVDLGLTNTNRYMPHNCIVCGRVRWVMMVRGQPENKQCVSCASRSRRGNRAGAWKGGKIKTRQGYTQILLPLDDFFFSMTNKDGYVMEHRLVMAKSLGRNLHRWEIVHHKNSVRSDNRLGNLQLVTDDRHSQITILENRILYLEKRVTLLEAENVILRADEASVYPG